MSKPRVWAFRSPNPNEDGANDNDPMHSEHAVKARDRLFEELMFHGNSRLGFSTNDINNLKLEDDEFERRLEELDTEKKQEMAHERRWKAKPILDIKGGDWIIHINLPIYGVCVSARSIDDYKFDAGLKMRYGYDFRHCIPVDPRSRLMFYPKERLGNYSPIPEASDKPPHWSSTFPRQLCFEILPKDELLETYRNGEFEKEKSRVKDYSNEILSVFQNQSVADMLKMIAGNEPIG